MVPDECFYARGSGPAAAEAVQTAGLSGWQQLTLDELERLDALAEGGLLILSTPNRTNLSRLAMITVAEGTGMIPRGTHDWTNALWGVLMFQAWNAEQVAN